VPQPVGYAAYVIIDAWEFPSLFILCQLVTDLLWTCYGETGVMDFLLNCLLDKAVDTLGPILKISYDRLTIKFIVTLS